MRGLHRCRRGCRHGRSHFSPGHPVFGADHGGHHRRSGCRHGAGLARRQGHLELGQLRRGRRSGHSSRHVLDVGSGVRGCRRRHLHRRRGSSANRGVEAPIGQGHLRPRHADLRPPGIGHHGGRTRSSVVDRHGGISPRWHRDHRGHPPHQGRAPWSDDGTRPLQRELRPQPRSPPSAQLGVPPRMCGSRTRRGHRPRQQDHAAGQD